MSIFKSKINKIEKISPRDKEEIMRLANIIYFQNKVYDETYWMGLKTAKCPMDMWVYQELIYSIKPDLIIETGTFHGGSALFFANMLDILGNGKVISIDIEYYNIFPKHERIEYITGSSLDNSIISQVKNIADSCNNILVILDSDHRSQFKLQELEVYSKFVSVGSYIIAEDSCFDYYPAWPEFGKGPNEAITEFTKNNTNFEIDRAREKHMISFAPRGFIKRTA